MSTRTFLLAGLTFALVSPACSLLLDDDATQCHANGDCARFPGTLCDQGQGICVTGFLAGAGGRSAGGSGGAANVGNGGAPALPAAGGQGGLAAGAGGAPAPSSAGCPDLDGNGVRDCLESLVPNADFAAGLAGWTAEPGITQSFSSSDGKGDPRSGALAITNPNRSPMTPGLTMAGSALCLPDTSAAAYDVYLEVAVGPASDGVVQGGITFAFHDSADCSGAPSGMAPATLLDQTLTGWRLVQEIIRPGQGTRSLLVRLVVVKPFDEASAGASFDNILIRAR
jgi:hypothetical protein